MSAVKQDDLAQYAEDAPRASGNALAVLSAIADEQAAAELEVARLEEELRKAQDRVKDIAERRLPEAMEEVGMKEFSTTTGLKVHVREDIRCNVSKERMPTVVKWLRDNKHRALIKRSLSLAFGAGEDKEAEKVLKKLKNHEVEDKQTVHPQTLAAFVREQLEKGVNIPLETFGVFRQKVAVINRPGDDKPRSKKRKGDEKAPF